MPAAQQGSPLKAETFLHPLRLLGVLWPGCCAQPEWTRELGTLRGCLGAWLLRSTSSSVGSAPASGAIWRSPTGLWRSCISTWVNVRDVPVSWLMRKAQGPGLASGSVPGPSALPGVQLWAQTGTGQKSGRMWELPIHSKARWQGDPCKWVPGEENTQNLQFATTNRGSPKFEGFALLSESPCSWRKKEIPKISHRHQTWKVWNNQMEYEKGRQTGQFTSVLDSINYTSRHHSVIPRVLCGFKLYKKVQ